MQRLQRNNHAVSWEHAQVSWQFAAQENWSNNPIFLSGPKNPWWRIGRDFCQKSRTWSWVKQTKYLMSYIRLKVSRQHIFLFYLYQLLINLWYYDHFVIRRRQSEELIFSDILYCRNAVRNDLLNVRETAFYWNW